MKLTIRANLEDTNLGAEFEIELPPRYSNVVRKSTEIIRIVTEGVERIKEQLERRN